ncbi:MAG: NADP-dependent oxidoreductase [Thermoproteota archaeon]|nr:NADP-dependent oxidoreductase [Thermoproteota archaeon]
MTNRIGTEIHLKQYPQGMPTEDIFETVRMNIPEPKVGEFLVRNIWMSVDPYMRGRMRSPEETKSYIDSFQLKKPLEGSCVGQIIESKNNQFRTGEYVLGIFGWREYWLSNGKDVMKIDSEIAPIQTYLSVLGMTGLTAYVGLLNIGKLNEGKDTVFVSAAAGAVGSIACQIAKIKGCHVVGSAGSNEKAEWLLDEIKLDYAFNYKTVGENNLSYELKKGCPGGIDLYFDNVGGKQLEAALDNIKTFGRIVLCGMISQYNATLPLPGPSNLFLSITNRVRIQGFIVRDHYDMLNEFHSSISKWIREGKLKWKETVIEGLEKAPKAFVGLFKGENFGKMLVKIGSEV